MFTGIIRELGTVARVQRARGVIRVSIMAPKIAPQVAQLDSVAINGVCVSVVSVNRQTIAFDVIPETQRLTTLGKLRQGQRANVEPSLSVVDRLGGQILFGHVDGVGTIVKRQLRDGEVILTVRLARELRRFLVPKGPIAVDGVSLTVGQTLGATSFSVHLIPETLRATTLGDRQVSEAVNLEVDYVSKLVWQFVGATTYRMRRRLVNR